MSDREKHNGNGKDHNAGEHIGEVVSFPSLAERDRERRKKERQTRQAERTMREPMINLPTATKLLVMALVAIHIITAVIFDPLWQYWVQTHLGFVPARYTGGAPFNWAAIISPVTYLFLHGNWLHLILNSLFLIALGAGLERWMGARKMLVLFFLCSVISVAVHFAFNLNSVVPVVGASGGVSGLFAAALVMLQERGAVPAGRYGLWPLIILWVGISALFGLMGGPGGSPVAWAAHIGGFLAGFLLLKPILRSRL